MSGIYRPDTQPDYCRIKGACIVVLLQTANCSHLSFLPTVCFCMTASPLPMRAAGMAAVTGRCCKARWLCAARNQTVGVESPWCGGTVCGAASSFAVLFSHRFLPHVGRSHVDCLRYFAVGCSMPATYRQRVCLPAGIA